MTRCPASLFVVYLLSQVTPSFQVSGRASVDMTAYIDSCLGYTRTFPTLRLFCSSSLCSRSTQSKTSEEFEEVMYLDLEARYGGTEAGRTVRCFLLQHSTKKFRRKYLADIVASQKPRRHPKKEVCCLDVSCFAKRNPLHPPITKFRNDKQYYIYKVFKHIAHSSYLLASRFWGSTSCQKHINPSFHLRWDEERGRYEGFWRWHFRQKC